MLRRDDTARGRLLAALDGVDRLVLLGDAIELRDGPVRDALAAAVPVLRALGAAVGEGGEVVIVPGNHDHELVSPWRERSQRRGAPVPIGLEAPVDWRGGEPLATVVKALVPAAVRVAYPGVWLRHDVYAMHGHYLDRHTTIPTFERLGAGAMTKIVRETAGGPATTEEYEAALAPLYAWMHSIAQNSGSDSSPPTPPTRSPPTRSSSHGASARAWGAVAGRRQAGWRAGTRQRAVAAGFRLAIAGFNRAGLGPLSADVTGSELRRAGVRAAGEVVSRLGVDARYVLFGHTHRAGPVPRDRRSEWLAPGGAALLNAGCWVHEPAFLGRDPRSSPYRAGFAVRLGGEGPPELVNLLD